MFDSQDVYKRQVQSYFDNPNTFAEVLILLLPLVLERTGYLASLRAQGFEGLTRIENVEELGSNIAKYCQENEEPTLEGFLEEVALYTDIDD